MLCQLVNGYQSSGWRLMPPTSGWVQVVRKETGMLKIFMLMPLLSHMFDSLLSNNKRQSI